MQRAQALFSLSFWPGAGVLMSDDLLEYQMRTAVLPVAYSGL